jgi:hypothetical protein
MESATHIPPDQGSSDPQSEAQLAYSLERGHEQRDASIKAIVIFVIVLTVSVVVIQFAVWGLEALLKYQSSMEDPQKVSSVAQPLGRRTPPPEPRLQPSPAHPSLDRDDWLTLLDRWNRQLNSYGKVEGDPSRARIPIDRAMEMAEKNGIRAVKPAPITVPQANGTPGS